MSTPKNPNFSDPDKVQANEPPGAALEPLEPLENSNPHSDDEDIKAPRKGPRNAKAARKEDGKPTAGRYRSVGRSYRDPYSQIEFNPAYAVPVDKGACTNWLQCQILAGLIVKE